MRTTLLVAAALLTASQAIAQTAPPAPSCSLSSSPGQTANVVESALACVLTPDGNGYVIWLTNTGTVRKTVCWGTGTCPTPVAQ
jgi:hypothetical protein